MRVCLARGRGAITRLGGPFQSLVLFCSVDAGDHVAKKVCDIKTRALKIAQLIGEEKVEYSAVFIILCQARHGFVGDGSSRRFGFSGDRFSFGIVFSLLQVAAL